MVIKWEKTKIHLSSPQNHPKRTSCSSLHQSTTKAQQQAALIETVCFGSRALPTAQWHQTCSPGSWQLLVRVSNASCCKTFTDACTPKDRPTRRSTSRCTSEFIWVLPIVSGVSAHVFKTIFEQCLSEVEKLRSQGPSHLQADGVDARSVCHWQHRPYKAVGPLIVVGACPGSC